LQGHPEGMKMGSSLPYRRRLIKDWWRHKARREV
jgi:hypothetical protein